MAVLFHEPIFATVVESGDQLYFYKAGTSTALTVYLDASLKTAAPQPEVADSDDRFRAIYFDPSEGDAKAVLHNADDEEKWTVDNYPVDDVDSLSDRVDTAETDIENLDGRVLAAESDIDSLEVTTTDHDDRLDDLESGTEGGSASVEVFTGSGTWSKPTGLGKAKVTVIAGGGGGVSFNLATYGGAGGGCAIKWLDAGDLGDTETVTVGSGGSGQSGSPGDQGGESSFGAHCSASGGEGGINQSAVPPDGGVGSSGDINLNGGTPDGQVAGEGTEGIPGGGSMLGYSRLGGTPQTPGAGGASIVSGSGRDGADGIIIVEEIF